MRSEDPALIWRGLCGGNVVDFERKTFEAGTWLFAIGLGVGDRARLG